MITTRDWQAEIDATNQVDTLRQILTRLNDAIVSYEDSPYAEEDAIYDRLHTLELLRDYGERKLEWLLA